MWLAGRAAVGDQVAEFGVSGVPYNSDLVLCERSEELQKAYDLLSFS